MADRNDASGLGGTKVRMVDLGAGTLAPATVSLLVPAEELVNDATADDSDKTFTVPAGTIWEPLFFVVTLVTQTTAGNRKMRLEIGDGANLWWFKEWTPVQAVSLTRNYFASVALPDDAAFDAAGRARMLYEPRFALPAGWTVRLFDVNAIAPTLDDMTVKVLGDSRAG